MLPANFGFMVVAVLVTWFIASMFRAPAVGNDKQLVLPSRYQQYYPNLDEVWQDQEAQMWDWIEDRVGMDAIPGLQHNIREERRKGFVRKYGEKTAGLEIKDRQVEEAIVVMEERLQSLKEMVEKSKFERQEKTKTQ